MKRIPLTKNLFLDEYIPKELYLSFENRQNILIGLLDSRLIKADQMLRDHFGAVTINNWLTGGDRNWSGIRTPDSSLFSFTSQHAHGRASDKLFANATAQEVREYIRKNWMVMGITCIEDHVSWVHSDVRNYSQNSLLIVQP